MPKISKMYPSRFLRPHELSKETRTHAIIVSIATEEFGNGVDRAAKLVAKLLLMDGSERELVINQRNGQRCAAAFGDDTDTWDNSEVVLWVEDVAFRGELVASVQMAPAPPPGLPAPGPDVSTLSKEVKQKLAGEDLDDEILF